MKTSIQSKIPTLTLLRVALVKSVQTVLKRMKADDVSLLWEVSMKAWIQKMKDEGE